MVYFGLCISIAKLFHVIWAFNVGLELENANQGVLFEITLL